MITSPVWLAVAGGLSGLFDDLFDTSESERYARRTVGPPVDREAMRRAGRLATAAMKTYREASANAERQRIQRAKRAEQQRLEREREERRQRAERRILEEAADRKLHELKRAADRLLGPQR